MADTTRQVQLGSEPILSWSGEHWGGGAQPKQQPEQLTYHPCSEWHPTSLPAPSSDLKPETPPALCLPRPMPRPRSSGTRTQCSQSQRQHPMCWNPMHPDPTCPVPIPGTSVSRTTHTWTQRTQRLPPQPPPSRCVPGPWSQTPRITLLCTHSRLPSWSARILHDSTPRARTKLTMIPYAWTPCMWILLFRTPHWSHTPEELCTYRCQPQEPAEDNWGTRYMGERNTTQSIDKDMRVKADPASGLRNPRPLDR